MLQLLVKLILALPQRRSQIQRDVAKCHGHEKESVCPSRDAGKNDCYDVTV